MHSLGGTRFRASMDMQKHVPPLLWLNLVCLDAPLVAIAWLGLFARTFGILLRLGNCVALFLTAWLIYLADRLADALALQPNLPRSLRQDFCLRHREIWIATVALVGGFDAYVIWRSTATGTFLAGAVVGALAVIYLVLNHPLGVIWRALPAKELAIGILFAAGTVVALLPHLPLTPTFAIAGIAFAALCSLNCIGIANWERELDRTQGKVSIATRHPRVAEVVGNVCLLLAFVGLILAIFVRTDGPFFGCIALSGLLLGWLNASPSIKEGRFTNRPRSRNGGINRRSLGTDQRTALADLVLLTPIVALIIMAL
ncbi:MAG TPA: hypothetical protein VJS88_08055 [Chthoniobacterales bacterium]|nr:hypothetical protein [Chthoniobacterales bacterium]